MTSINVRPSACDFSPLDSFVQRCISPLVQGLAQVESQIPPESVAVRGDQFHSKVAALFEQSQAACREFEATNRQDADLVAEAKKLFLSATAPWFDRSWIAHRSRSKPSGFPGDFDMLIKLYQQTTPATGIGAYLDLCIQDLPLARAVRARMQCARDFLVRSIELRSGSVRVLDIASGPCREFQNWPTLSRDAQVEVVAMDSDPLALEYVKSQVATQLPETVRLRPVRHNALRTRSSKATIQQFGRFDLIYSVGLCDYLTDDHLVSLLSAWRETLQEGGALYVAFKDTVEYDHTPYQWHLDWYFYQRTHEDVLALYRAAGFDVEALEISRDTTGIITNYIYHDQPATIQRVDGGHTSVPRRKSTRVKTDVTEEA